MEESRTRRRNFSHKETWLLKELIKKHRSVLLNKKSNRVSWATKDNAWEEITRLFNLKTSYYRDKDSLKGKWETLKKAAKKRHTAVSTQKTSSDHDTSDPIIPNEIIDEVINILEVNDESMSPDHNGSNTEDENKTDFIKIEAIPSPQADVEKSEVTAEALEERASLYGDYPDSEDSTFSITTDLPSTYNGCDVANIASLPVSSMETTSAKRRNGKQIFKEKKKLSNLDSRLKLAQIRYLNMAAELKCEQAKMLQLKRMMLLREMRNNK